MSSHSASRSTTSKSNTQDGLGTTLAAALPWLYLKGISTGDLRDALTVLVGDQAQGLSSNVVSRLKGEWANEYSVWMKRDLTALRYVYWWADVIHTGLRQEEDARQCLLVIIGVLPDGRKELVTIGDGLRESKESWLDVLRDLAHRGLSVGQRLAVGYGALGFWAALDAIRVIHQFRPHSSDEL